MSCLPSFAGMYEANVKGGKPSIAPEKLLRAMLLQVFYSVRSERQLMEQTQSRTCCFAGLSGWPWMMPYGCPQFSPKTANA